MFIVKDGGALVNESDEESRAFFADPSFVHYIGMLQPPCPGISDCFQTLEHKYFKPKTPRNDLFLFRILMWMDILWGIVSIPMEEKDKMERAAQVSGLRATHAVPSVVASGKIYQFPIKNERAFALVNISGHPVYHRLMAK